ncbi:MAG: ABC transporter permease, partial [Sphingomonadales bacterium]|nr:ABC transporter permease [Sphingomonadales bacterium]
VVVAEPANRTAVEAADTQLRPVFRRSEAPPKLIVIAPGDDPAKTAQAAMQRTDVEVTATLYGSQTAPTILYAANATRSASYLAALAEASVRVERTGTAPLSRATKIAYRPDTSRTTISGSNQAGFFAVFGLFILTLMLAGQAVGTMAEERSNKVIEILAAAVPLESVFLGKLVGMFGVAVLFVAFWGTIAVNVGQLLPAGMARAFADVGPAVGPVFPLLFFAYFTMAYLLLGAVFLGIGAQASTPREIQMLSLPITIFQVAMFALSQAAASQPESTIARIAEILPFSSPFAMAARAANRPEIWPHLLALGWQALWVALTVWLGARLFRRGVLQSGSPAFWKRKKAVVA